MVLGMRWYGRWGSNWTGRTPTPRKRNRVACFVLNKVPKVPLQTEQGSREKQKIKKKKRNWKKREGNKETHSSVAIAPDRAILPTRQEGIEKGFKEGLRI